MWVHERSDIDVHEHSAMDLDSRAVSERVTKQIVTIFSKTCKKSNWFMIFFYKKFKK